MYPRTTLIACLFFLLSISAKVLEDRELNDFSVYVSASTIKIHWTSPLKSDITQYLIQRSGDKKNFKTLKEVPAKKAEAQIVEYVETDVSPLAGWSYYRVVQVLSNGEEIIHDEIAPVFFAGNRVKRGKAIVAPNPFNPEQMVEVPLESFSDKEHVLVLRDQQGKEYSVTMEIIWNGKVFQSLNEELPLGKYIITASSEDALIGQMVEVI